MLNSSCLKLIGVPILGAFAWLAASAARRGDACPAGRKADPGNLGKNFQHE